jgi:hypothetical protein
MKLTHILLFVVFAISPIVAFSQEESDLVLVWHPSGRITVWDPFTGEEVFEQQMQVKHLYITGVTVTKDSLYYMDTVNLGGIVSGDNRIVVYDISENTYVSIYERTNLSGFVLLPDEKHISIGGFDQSAPRMTIHVPWERCFLTIGYDDCKFTPYKQYLVFQAIDHRFIARSETEGSFIFDINTNEKQPISEEFDDVIYRKGNLDDIYLIDDINPLRHLDMDTGVATPLEQNIICPSGWVPGSMRPSPDFTYVMGMCEEWQLFSFDTGEIIPKTDLLRGQWLSDSENIVALIYSETEEGFAQLVRYHIPTEETHIITEFPEYTRDASIRPYTTIVVPGDLFND